MANVVDREPCPQCRASGGDTSGDNLVRYDSGGGWCFACGFCIPNGDPTPVTFSVPSWTPLVGEVEALPHRGISAETCTKFDYRVLDTPKGRVEIAPYHNAEGALIAQKLRAPNKRFAAKGAMNNAGLWGAHRWKGGTKRLTITEGEIDAMSVSQAFNNRWPVVSIPNGTAGAEAAIRRDFEFVSSFQEVVFCFDSDKPGQAAAIECAKLLRPGVASIAHLPRKDANEMVLARETDILLRCIYEAKPYRPDGIVAAREALSSSGHKVRLYPFPWDALNERLYGQATSAITMVTSGSGMGKSTWVRQIVHDHLKQGRKVGVAMLEEAPSETVHDIMGIQAGLPIREILSRRRTNEELERQGRPLVEFVDSLSDEVYKATISDPIFDNLFLYDHRGECVADEILPKLEYLAVAMGCEVLVLDHVTQLAAIGANGEGERRWIDNFMVELRSLVERTDTHLMCVTQLRKADGKPYEEGGRITLQDLRGSGMLSQAPNTVIAIERDQQNPDPSLRNVVTVRVLKDRLSGFTGEAMALRWNHHKSRLEECDVDTTLLFNTEEIFDAVRQGCTTSAGHAEGPALQDQ